jgi:hypothetical protein
MAAISDYKFEELVACKLLQIFIVWQLWLTERSSIACNRIFVNVLLWNEDEDLVFGFPYNTSILFNPFCINVGKNFDYSIMSQLTI